jgi:hypothetical protein
MTKHFISPLRGERHPARATCLEPRGTDGAKPKEFGVCGSPVERIKLTGGETLELFLTAGIDAAIDHFCHLCNESTIDGAVQAVTKITQSRDLFWRRAPK